MTEAGGGYHLGIDLGTTYVAAGILRQGRPEIVTLGDRAPVVPSVLFFKEDGEVLTGESATRRGLSDPTRVAREFKRRVGDTTPMVVGQTPYSADVLLAKLLRHVFDAVVKRQGGAPESVAITHPANWGAYKIDVLQQAMRMADLNVGITTLTEPVAAAIHYAATERLEPGSTVAVYDLGGGTFDAAVLRAESPTGDASDAAAGFSLLGDVEGIERLGGIDFDEAVFQHVLRWCSEALTGLDLDDGATMQALARLRMECAEAKEALSTDTDVSIPVVLPNLQTEVRLTRAEFEAMIRPLLQQTVEALRRSIRSAGVEDLDLAAVLLVGGSSRIPLIAEMVGSEVGRPLAVDQHPKHTVALGAAIAAARSVGATAPEPASPSPAAPVIDPVPSNPTPPTVSEPVAPVSPVGPAVTPAQPVGSLASNPAPVTPAVPAVPTSTPASPAVQADANPVPAVTQREDEAAKRAAATRAFPAPSLRAESGPIPSGPIGSGSPGPVAEAAPTDDGLSTRIDVGPPRGPVSPGSSMSAPAASPPAGASHSPSPVRAKEPRRSRSDRIVGTEPRSANPASFSSERRFEPGTPLPAPAPARSGVGGAVLIGVLTFVFVLVVGGLAVAALRGDGTTDAGDDPGTTVPAPAAPSDEDAQSGVASTVGGATAADGADEQATGEQQSGGEDADGEAYTPDESTDDEAPTSTAETTTSTTPADTGLTATITGITIDGDQYVVRYSTDFDPVISDDTASHHLHFYFDTVDVSDAGQPGGGPWKLFDGAGPFREYGPSDRPSGAEKMCVTVATHDHAVDDTSRFHCLTLPDA